MGVREMIILADRELIGRAQGFKAAGEEDEHHKTEQRPDNAAEQEFARHHAEHEPVIQRQDDQQGDENKERVLFRQDQAAKTEDVGGESRPVVRCAQIFPKHAEAKERPKVKKPSTSACCDMWIWVGAKPISAAMPKAHQGPFRRQAKIVKAAASGC